jgi:voltage-gated potassium channel
MKKQIYEIIFHHNTKAGKLFDVVLLWSILLSVFVVIIESIPEIHQNYYIWFYAIEWTLTILFTIEYILRIYSSPNPIKYIFSFWGIIDLLSIIPTYANLFLSGTFYLSIIRMFRLLRVFRISKLARFNKEAIFLLNALKSSSYKISVFLMAVITIVTILGTVMYVIEGPENGFTSIPLSIYWAIVTITTVGFGDLVPQTALGKMLASFTMIIGYSIIAVPTGIITFEIAKGNKNRKCGNCKQDCDIDANYCSNCGTELKNED